MRALEFGPLDELIAAHPDAVDQIAVLPDAAETMPSVRISPRAAALEGTYRQLTM
jgi:anaerobic dimethyl sulfoxide reductase subunit B (iron-sulfur subunit)